MSPAAESNTVKKRQGYWWLPLAFVSFAAVAMWLPRPVASLARQATVTSEWATDITPVRQPSRQPAYRVAVFQYRCSDCHRIIPSPYETDRTLTQHKEVVLEHGINTRCFNCHHRTDRDAFVDDFGQRIPWDQPQLLCAKCHGPVYRDWQHGSHGRLNGYWDQTRGAQERRKCIECHDPHIPPFPPMKPAPGPEVVGEWPSKSTEHGQEPNPLRIKAANPANDEGH